MTARPNTAEQLGRLAAQMEMMNAQLLRDRDDLAKRDKEAAKSRDEVRQSQAKQQASLDDLLRRMDKVEPVTDMVTGWKAKVIGAMFVMGMIGTAILGFLTYFKQQISQLLWGA